MATQESCTREPVLQGEVSPRSQGVQDSLLSLMHRSGWRGIPRSTRVILPPLSLSNETDPEERRESVAAILEEVIALIDMDPHDDLRVSAALLSPTQTTTSDAASRQ